MQKLAGNVTILQKRLKCSIKHILPCKSTCDIDISVGFIIKMFIVCIPYETIQKISKEEIHIPTFSSPFASVSVRG